MITVIASIEVTPDNVIRFIELFNENVPNVLAEDGCLKYYPTVDIKTNIPIQDTDSSMVTIIEVWESIEALKRHLEAPHMIEYQEQSKDLVLNVSIKVLQSV